MEFLSCAANVIAALLVLKVRAKIKGKELIYKGKELFKHFVTFKRGWELSWVEELFDS